MLRTVLVCLMVCVVLVAAPMALAANYEWSAGGSDDLWDNDDNWTIVSGICGGAGSCHPGSSADDALIEGPQTVDVTEETIDDLTIAHDDGGTTTLDDGGTDATLTVDLLTLENTASAHVTNTFVIEIRGAITITNVTP